MVSRWLVRHSIYLITYYCILYHIKKDHCFILYTLHVCEYCLMYVSTPHQLCMGYSSPLFCYVGEFNFFFLGQHKLHFKNKVSRNYRERYKRVWYFCLLRRNTKLNLNVKPIIVVVSHLLSDAINQSRKNNQNIFFKKKKTIKTSIHSPQWNDTYFHFFFITNTYFHFILQNLNTHNIEVYRVDINDWLTNINQPCDRTHLNKHLRDIFRN